MYETVKYIPEKILAEMLVALHPLEYVVAPGQRVTGRLASLVQLRRTCLQKNLFTADFRLHEG